MPSFLSAPKLSLLVLAPLGAFALVAACTSSNGDDGAMSGPGGSGGASGALGDDGVASGDTGTAGMVTADGGAAGTESSVGAQSGASGVADPGTQGDGEVKVGPDDADYAPDPNLTDLGKPRGKSFQFTMDSADSQIFKGLDATLNPENQHTFKRQINVYVPAQYQDGTAAPILVIHDGPAQIGLVSYALDNLTIAEDPSKRLPAFIAIAVANGGGDSKGSERGLEYDTVSDRFVRFIETEVLPAVLRDANIHQAYPHLAFTSDPEGRATLGCSSGGAAAFTMGWFRPDLFRRIITYSGTFVDQQDDDAPEKKTYPDGAWDYHSELELITNSPMKPLRVFLDHSDHDNGYTQPESGHHNWVLANQRMAAALQAKGNHYRHLTALNAGHCDAKIFPRTLGDTLLWAWRGYPVVAGGAPTPLE